MRKTPPGRRRGFCLRSIVIPGRVRSTRTRNPVGPAKKRASFFFSETLTMFKGAKNKDGAWKFLTWMMDDEADC